MLPPYTDECVICSSDFSAGGSVRSLAAIAAKTLWEQYIKNLKLKTPDYEPDSIHGWFKQRKPGNPEPCQDPSYRT